MQYTNRLGLPAALVAAVANDPYSAGDADISITRLLAPPKQVALMKAHAAELTEDVADRIWALRSQGIHAVLERAVDPDPNREALVTALKALRRLQDAESRDRIDLERTIGHLDNVLTAYYPPSAEAANEIAEVRWDTTCLGWKVSGKLDLVSLADGVLTDWKDTSVWAIKDALDPTTKGKVEWEQQTNLLAYLGRPHGYDIKAVQVVAFGRDWRKNEKLRFGDDYPDAEVGVIPLPLWTPEQAQAFLEERVAEHQRAQLGIASVDDYFLPDCTPEERWEQATVYAVHKKGNKSAVRLYQDAALAKQHADGQPGLEVRVRPGKSPRCQQYCSALPFCQQGQAIVAATQEIV